MFASLSKIPRQPVPSRGIARINLKHLLEKCIRLRKCLGSSLPSNLHSLEVKRVSLRVGFAHCRLRAQQRHLQLLHHLARDLILDLEDVVELAVVGLRPKM